MSTVNTVKIGTRNDRAAFRPTETIEGAIGWELSQEPAAIEVRLFWHTRGKGTEDVVVADRVRFEKPGLQGAQPFRFQAPLEPVSFSGRLISVVWALEVVVADGPSARVDLVIAPDGQEIVLGAKAATPPPGVAGA